MRDKRGGHNEDPGRSEARLGKRKELSGHRYSAAAGCAVSLKADKQQQPPLLAAPSASQPQTIACSCSRCS
jgi:hypothetical protein